MNGINDHFWLHVNELPAGVEKRTAVFNYKCKQMGGTSEMRYFRASFEDEDQPGKVQVRELRGGNVCTIGGTAAWGMALGMARGTTRSNMFKANYTFEYLTPDMIARDIAQRDLALEAIELNRRACVARFDEETALLRSEPRVGMQTLLGVIVDVRTPLASIQYSPSVRPKTTRDIEWLPIAGLTSPTRCAAAPRGPLSPTYRGVLSQ